MNDIQRSMNGIAHFTPEIMKYIEIFTYENYVIVELIIVLQRVIWKARNRILLKTLSSLLS